jgi:hypothetical protein
MTSTDDETNKLSRKKKLEMIGAATSGLENLNINKNNNNNNNNNSNSDLENSGGVSSNQNTNNKLTTKSILKNNSHEKLTDGHTSSNYLTSSSNIQLESTSLSSLSSSPSASTALNNNNLFTYNNNSSISADKSSIGSNTSNKSPTMGASTNLYDSSSSSLATNSNHSSKTQISSSLREKLAKAIKKTTSSSNNKKLISTNSESLMIQHPSKSRRGLMRSNQGNSFFSRSCPGEELASYGLEEEDLNDLNNENNTANNSTNNNTTTLNPPLNNQNNSKDKKSKSGDFIKASRQTMLAKSFIQFTTKVVRSKKRSDATSSVTSSTASMNSAHDDPFNTSRSNNVNRIGNFEVDFDKLARELALPSLNKPLTSFKDIKPDDEKDESKLDNHDINKLQNNSDEVDDKSKSTTNNNDNSRPVLRSSLSLASPSPPPISKTLVRSNTNKSDIE